MSNEKTIFGLLNIDSLQVGQRIREIRGSRKQGPFGKKLGVSQNAVKNYEKGRMPPDEMFFKLAAEDELERGPLWLLTGSVVLNYNEVGTGTTDTVVETSAPYDGGDKRQALMREFKELMREDDLSDIVIDALLTNVRAFRLVPRKKEEGGE